MFTLRIPGKVLKVQPNSEITILANWEIEVRPSNDGLNLQSVESVNKKSSKEDQMALHLGEVVENFTPAPMQRTYKRNEKSARYMVPKLMTSYLKKHGRSSKDEIMLALRSALPDTSGMTIQETMYKCRGIRREQGQWSLKETE